MSGPGPHVFVGDLERPELDDDDRHHLARSLRLRTGDAMTITDGADRWRPARFGPTVEPDGDIVTVVPPSPPITVGLTPVKGSRPEWAVQKLTELGVDVIWLLVAERSVVRWDGDRDGPRQKMARVAREAAMQSRRCSLPSIEVGVPLVSAVAAPGAAIADHAGGPPDLARPVVLVGPEGGWTESERAMASASVGLGPTVLRAETAAVVAASLLVGLRSGLVNTLGG